MKILSIISLLFVICFSGSAIAGVNMQEGNWETTVEMTMEGLPFPMPPTTYAAHWAHC